MRRRFSGSELVVATHNQGKLEEISELLRPFRVAVLAAADLGLQEPRETEDSFVGNARLKARFAATATGIPALADDSGICVDVLGGAPGVYTADWAATESGRDFDLAMRKTWDLVNGTCQPAPYLAQFRSTLVLAWPDGYDEVFEGAVDGELTWPPVGTLGHGYDPMFRPHGYSITFGEMERWEKNRISHRAVAFRDLIAGCFT